MAKLLTGTHLLPHAEQNRGTPSACTSTAKPSSNFQPSSAPWLSSRRSALIRLSSLLLATPTMGSAVAANNVIRLIVPVPAGGGMDATARVLAERLSRSLGPIVVENKPGASLRLGIHAVRNAAADGTVLLYAPTSTLTVYPHVYQQLGYDADTDFVPVVSTTSFEFALGVPANSSFHSLGAYLEAARSNSQRFGLYGVPGAGTGAHFVGAALAQASGTHLTHIPYRGSAPLMQDLLGSQIVSACNVVGEFSAYHAAGKVKVLATTGKSRSQLLPGVPTFSELGYPNLVLDEQFGLFAPKGTPTEIVQRISAAVVEASADGEVQRRFLERGYLVRAIGHSDFALKIRTDRKTWGPIVEATGFALSNAEEVVKRSQ